MLNYFCCYFSHDYQAECHTPAPEYHIGIDLIIPCRDVPRDNKSHLQKESGPKVLSFSWNLVLRGQNDSHYEIIGVDVVALKRFLIFTRF